jgi:urease accessory protein
MSSKRIVLATAFTCISAPALAHTVSASASEFTAGFMHPMGGIDHILAMVAVGLLAALLGGRALWAVPASFVLTMLVGGALALAGIEVPAVEGGILASIIILGAVVAMGRTLSLKRTVALVGMFAVFHGYAHGAEMPLEANAISYSVGFATATALLHGVGILIGFMSFKDRQIVRFVGAVAAFAGIFLTAV